MSAMQYCSAKLLNIPDKPFAFHSEGNSGSYERYYFQIFAIIGKLQCEIWVRIEK